MLDTDGQVLHPVTGTPQGGTVSPVLAKVFLHYVLDRWLEKVVKRHGRGEACLMRSADDFVCAFAAQADAERFDNVLGRRREQCGLELSGAKTRIIPCSRYRQAGNMRFEFLGFAFRWGKDRKGKDHRKRRTARTKLRSALKRFTAWSRSIGINDSQGFSRGCTPHFVGTTITTESTGMPPACKSFSTKPYGCCASGSIGVVNVTVTPGKATTKSWSTSTLPDHGS